MEILNVEVLVLWVWYLSKVKLLSSKLKTSWSDRLQTAAEDRRLLTEADGRVNTTNLWIHPAWSTVQAAAGQCVSVCGDNVLFCTCGHLIPPERGVVADHVHPFIATAFHLLTTHMSPRAASPDTMMSSVKSTVSRSQSKRAPLGWWWIWINLQFLAAFWIKSVRAGVKV